MFRIESEQAFLDAFRPRDRKHVEIPRDVRFPLVARDYVAWTDPSAVRVFLLFTPSGSKHPVGIAFRRDQTGYKPSPSAMCEWCHSYGNAEEIGLVTADANSKKRVGITACLDLRCKDKVEDAANRAGANCLAESKKMIDRMTRFTSEALGISDAVRESGAASTRVL